MLYLLEWNADVRHDNFHVWLPQSKHLLRYLYEEKEKLMPIEFIHINKTLSMFDKSNKYVNGICVGSFDWKVSVDLYFKRFLFICRAQLYFLTVHNSSRISCINFYQHKYRVNEMQFNTPIPVMVSWRHPIEHSNLCAA